MPITWERMFPTGGWKPNKPHNVKSMATSNIAVLENEEVNNTEKKSRFGEAATLELSNNYFREKSPNSAAMLMESKAAARTLKVGSRGEDVKRLQENLNTLGYNTGKPDGIFGNGTKNAVIAFQRAKGLTADGIVGSGTQNAITRALNEKTAAANSNILKVGSKGAKVTQLQRNLNSLGYNAGTPDGAFGTGTKNAVVSFQKTYGLSADGVAGKATLDAIATTISRKSKGILSKGQVSNDVRNLQNDLKTLGYLASNADGAFGTGTEAAVKAFQKNHKLTQDGLVGASTRSQISAAVKAKIERENSVLKLGSKGDKVKNLQSNLNELGYKAGTPDGQFGSGTQDAVIRFQKTYGLTPDGQAGTNTLNAISKSLNYKRNNVLAKGQVSEDVRNLQNNLKSLGYLSGTADGAFGAGTEAALKAFQKRHGLTEDGLAGKNTRVKIADAVKNKTASPVNASKVLKLGSSGAEVEKLQKDLKDIGYTISDTAGTFGNSTQTAVMTFQKAMELEADGKVGSNTRRALNTAVMHKRNGKIARGHAG
ncbi:MAG: peptidoglycan-binding protein, partial [Pseudobutyrivibrio sp.]|nr:peptidoglycan-binding protein [Pseudobutyrivibrio sp.]